MTIQHIDDQGQHIDELDHRVTELREAFSSLGGTDDFDELIKIMHVNGWTTLVDLAFMNALVDATFRCVADARALRIAVLEGARLIADAGR